MLDKTFLKGFWLHKTENFCLSLPEGINPMQTQYLNSTRKSSSQWDERFRPGWITMKTAQLLLPQWLPLLGQQASKAKDSE